MNQSNTNSLALQDILLSIADSLNKAQNQLNNIAPYDEYGRPNTIYHLPYLDFNIQVLTEFDTQNTVPNATQKAIGETFVNSKTPTLSFKPAPLSSTTSANKNETRVESSISGRFVAVVPNDGAPQVFIQTEVEQPIFKQNFYESNIKVRLQNACNELLINTKVELNFDKTTSESFRVLSGGLPLFDKNEGLTNQSGEINFAIKLNANDYNNGCFFCFIVNTANIYKNISINKL